MAGVTVDIRANAQAYEQAMQRIGQLHDRYERRLRDMGQTSSRVGRQEIELNRAKARVLRDLETPQDRHNQKIGELDRLLKAKKISQDQYNQAARNARTELDGVAAGGEKAFGSRQIQSLKSYVTGMMGATAIIAMVKGGLQEIIRMGEEAAARARASITDIGQLRQVATSQEDFEGLVGQTRQIQGMGIEETRAAQLVFAARSAGLQPEEAMLMGEMESTGFIGDTLQMARSARAMQRATPTAGDFETIVSGALAASGGAPAAAQDILAASAEAAAGVGSLPVSPEELMSTIASVSEVGGHAQAGTQIRSLLRSLTRVRAEGEVDLTGAGSLLEMVERVEAMGLDDAELMKLYGRQEAMMAHRLILGGGEGMAQLQAQVERAPGEGLLRERMAFTDPSLDAAVESRAAAGTRDVGLVDLGERMNLADAMRTNIEDSMREAGYSEASIMWSTRGRRKITDMWDPEGRAGRHAQDVLDAPEEVRDTRGWQRAVGAISRQPEAFGVSGNERLEQLLERAIERLEPDLAPERARRTRRRDPNGDGDSLPEEERRLELLEREERLIERQERAAEAQERAAVQLGRNAGGGPTLAPLNDD